MKTENYTDEIQKIGLLLENLNIKPYVTDLNLLLKCCDRLRYELIHLPYSKTTCYNLIKDVYADVEYASYCINEYIRSAENSIPTQNTELIKKMLLADISLIAQQIFLPTTYESKNER